MISLLVMIWKEISLRPLDLRSHRTFFVEKDNMVYLSLKAIVYNGKNQIGDKVNTQQHI